MGHTPSKRKDHPGRGTRYFQHKSQICAGFVGAFGCNWNDSTRWGLSKVENEMTFLKRIMTAPVFEDEIKTQQAYMLHMILWTLICVPIPFVIYTLIINPQQTARTLTQVLFTETVSLLLLALLRRGYVHITSILQVLAFWFLFTASAMTGNGVQGESYLLGYGLVIVVAGILLGGIGAFVFTFL